MFVLILRACLPFVVGFVTLIVTVTAVTAVVREGILDLVQETPIFVFMLFLLLGQWLGVGIGIGIGISIGRPRILGVMAVAFEDAFDLVGHVAEAVTLVVLLVLGSWFAGLQCRHGCAKNGAFGLYEDLWN